MSPGSDFEFPKFYHFTLFVHHLPGMLSPRVPHSHTLTHIHTPNAMNAHILLTQIMFCEFISCAIRRRKTTQCVREERTERWRFERFEPRKRQHLLPSSLHRVYFAVHTHIRTLTHTYLTSSVSNYRPTLFFSFIWLSPFCHLFLFSAIFFSLCIPLAHISWCNSKYRSFSFWFQPILIHLIPVKSSFFASSAECWCRINDELSGKF